MLCLRLSLYSYASHKANLVQSMDHMFIPESSTAVPPYRPTTIPSSSPALHGPQTKLLAFEESPGGIQVLMSTTGSGRRERWKEIRFRKLPSNLMRVNCERGFLIPLFSVLFYLHVYSGLYYAIINLVRRLNQIK